MGIGRFQYNLISQKAVSGHGTFPKPRNSIIVNKIFILSTHSLLSKECLAILMDIDPTEKPTLQAGVKGGGTNPLLKQKIMQLKKGSKSI